MCLYVGHAIWRNVIVTVDWYDQIRERVRGKDGWNESKQQ